MTDAELAETIERTQWDPFWLPKDARYVDRPELMYFACPRDVPILNCVTRTRASEQELPGLVAEVGEAHRSVTSRWLVRPIAVREPLDRVLERAGYRPAVELRASVIGVDDFRPHPVPALAVRAVTTMTELRTAVALIDRSFPGGLPYTDEQLESDLANCTGTGARVQRFIAYDRVSGEPVATGGMTLFPRLRFGYLWAGCTIAEARGRGAYHALVAARIARARELGLGHVGLYAITTTSAPIVARLGFRGVEMVHYWERRGPSCASPPIRPTGDH